MGAQSSKSIRKLPKSSLPKTSPGTRIPPPSHQAPPPPAEEIEDESSGPIDYGSIKEDVKRQGTGQRQGTVEFSGEKDDAIRKDAMDPQFMQNLHKLGPVEIHDAGKFVPAAAQRTLRSRKDEFTSSSQTAPAGHLTFPFLASLLDGLKTLPPGSDPASLYKQYGVDKEKMEELRKWVNSVSVEEEDIVRVEEGNEIREMKAVWIGGVKKS
ncbi:hypothetical protein C343_06983 [Cryptococcus neoformans C23]|uniref:Uncharacterized protein n=2 Tax=Cryptococcus neoformans TaxID=5207 RepID=A0A854QHG1_CRYNE|nr:hypothetical protein CNAG_05569 [Cryptococcus neoformans var. grubii H99]AUB29221.1 hypothetical protein CKF44_05569 [Cryptococcus neoformans var. grubii]OWZ25941.1 hypothetical protein C347_06910 [Cryptococcus neoformans var. grubii AD2-60a]OWZ37970.1 hypothetical protein C343_06983 [Cryptococcus neoformans var. grubii C23]OWZ49713.1 hypothetical protein C368_06987 [Cryptococcus neoformans var. grubii 125.91]OXC80847.1 hypothetical protein C344_06883 [Cryptococcus neoformans var. grubii AD|eukprot:XP_012053851.1 hypothetical protein CNAG_05569 [Cryptococcus neoformans var. grubii H99]